MDEHSQASLLRRFERKKWLEHEDSGTKVVPGIRFYFELADVFNLKNLKTCEVCKSLIVYNETICNVCHSSVHSDCMDTNKLGAENSGCHNCSKEII